MLWDVYADIPVRQRLAVPSLAGHASGRAQQHRDASLSNSFLCRTPMREWYSCGSYLIPTKVQDLRLPMCRFSQSYVQIFTVLCVFSITYVHRARADFHRPVAGSWTIPSYYSREINRGPSWPCSRPAASLSAGNRLCRLYHHDRWTRF